MYGFSVFGILDSRSEVSAISLLYFEKLLGGKGIKQTLGSTAERDARTTMKARFALWLHLLIAGHVFETKFKVIDELQVDLFRGNDVSEEGDLIGPIKNFRLTEQQA